MPFTFGAFALASLSMIGAPPVSGSSKWYLLNGAFDAGSIAVIIVLLAIPAQCSLISRRSSTMRFSASDPIHHHHHDYRERIHRW